MRLVFTPILPKGVLSITQITSRFSEFGETVHRKLLDSLSSDTQFMELFLLSCDLLKPEITLYGNSFVQEFSLLKLFEISKNFEVHITSECTTTEKYSSKYQYYGLYKIISKNQSRVFLNCINSEKHVISKNEEDCVLKLMLIAWRCLNMGEITDAISKALNSLGVSDYCEQNEDDCVKESMRLLGMESTQSCVEKMPSKKDFINPPIEERQMGVDENEDVEETGVWCKVNESANTMVLMFSDLSEFTEVFIGDTPVKTLTFELPDFNSSSLQLLNLLSKEAETEVKRVPIILSKDSNSSLSEPSSKKSIESQNSSSEQDELKARKQELDSLIKKARIDKDFEKLDELRKERRKVRAEINKL